MEKLLIIDGNSIANRAFYALPLLSNSKGEFSNAVYGFVNILTKTILDLNPTHIAIAFDYGKKTFRNEIYSEYKATRKGMPNELAVQMPILKKLLKTMGISYFEKQNIEADDIIGTLCKTPNCQKILLSGDRDLFQLLNNETIMWFPKKGVTEIEIITENNLKDKMGINPNQVVDYKALRGDSSDNIPGVAGVGEKTAISLIETYSTLENIYENIENISGKLKEKLENGKKLAFVSKQLATIKQDVELEYSLSDLTFEFPYSKETFNFFKEYEFNSLIKRKDIFQENFSSSASNNHMFETSKIENEEQLNKVISYIKSEGKIAFDFEKGFSFSCSANVLYNFENEITLFNDTLSADDGILKLKDVFENSKILKICKDLKTAKHILDNYKIKISGPVFDLSIAKYLIGQPAISEPISPPFFFFLEKELTEKLEEFDLLNLYNKIEIPLVEILFSMEKDGLLVNTNELSKLKSDLESELVEITSKITTFAGEEFNINSPKQLSNILFNKLGLSTRSNKKLSTSFEILQNLENEHPIVSEILKYRKIQKLLATYVDAFLKIAASNGGYVRSIFNQTLTATGRLSSSDPNLQNLPIKSEEGKNFRKIFVSRFENGKLVSADYNQIELRLMAHYSQDETLIASYNRNEDIHKRTASEIFDVALNNVTPLERRLAKTVNFGIIYGISEYGLSVNLNTSVKKAGEYMRKYFERFPRIKEYMQEAVELAKENGFAKTLFGRIRFIPELKSENSPLRKFGERVAINMPLQGTASDIIKLAMINVFNKLKEQKLQSKLVLQVHDELILDCPPEEVETVEKLLKEEMEKVVSLSIPLPVEVSSGKTLFDCK